MIATLEKKAELKYMQKKFKNLQAFCSSYFRGKSYFESEGTQNNVVFLPIHNILKRFVILIKLQLGNIKVC